MVPAYRHTDLGAINRAAENEPQTTFLVVVEDFDWFNEAMPDLWRRMSSTGMGGIPSNVWIGAGIKAQKEADELMRRLIKIRARVLFLMLKKGHRQALDLYAGLIAWRCRNCGRREGFARLNRPKVCPSGTLCDGALLGPQIHWVVSMDPYESSARAKRCARLGVAFWDGETNLEVPE
jgi:hypothetical protein